MRLAFIRCVVCLVMALAASTARAQSVPEFQKILEACSAALDGNDIETLVGLYHRDGVFMGEDFKAAVGLEAVRASYKALLAALKVNLRFSLREAEQSGDLGWARANSTGTVKVLATGAQTQQSFNVLVVFRRETDAWKIRSYLYASDKAAPGEVPK